MDEDGYNKKYANWRSGFSLQKEKLFESFTFANNILKCTKE